MSAQGFNEGKGKPFTAADVRFTQAKDGKTLYAIVLGAPGHAASAATTLDGATQTLPMLYSSSVRTNDFYDTTTGSSTGRPA